MIFCCVMTDKVCLKDQRSRAAATRNFLPLGILRLNRRQCPVSNSLVLGLQTRTTTIGFIYQVYGVLRMEHSQLDHTPRPPVSASSFKRQFTINKAAFLERLKNLESDDFSVSLGSSTPKSVWSEKPSKASLFLYKLGKAISIYLWCK